MCGKAVPHPGAATAEKFAGWRQVVVDNVVLRYQGDCMPGPVTVATKFACRFRQQSRLLTTMQWMQMDLAWIQ